MSAALKAFAGIGLVCAATSANAEWRRFETQHFIIYSESNDKRVDELATGLEKTDGLMRMATGLPMDGETVKVRIYEMADEGQVQTALGSDSNTGVAGFYTSNILGPYAVTLRRVVAETDYQFTPELVLHHEYAHHFMLQYFPATYPSWYIEGFAELIGSSKALPDGKIAYGYPAKQRGHDIGADWVDMRKVLLDPPEKVLLNLYGQGWAMTHYLTFSKDRAGLLRRYLAALTAGKTPAEAASVFGDLDTLNRQARAYVTSSVFDYKPVDVRIQQPVVQKVSPVGPAEAALIPETIAFSDFPLSEVRKQGDREKEEKHREDVLRHVRSKAAQFPNDPYALYLLGQFENAAGNKAEAEVAADRLLALQPSHVGGMVLKSMLLSDKATAMAGAARAQEAERARALAVAANKSDPDNPLTYIAFYKTYPAAGLAAPTDAVNALATAVEKLPSNENVRLMFVNELVNESRYAEAMFALSPIANDPHDSPMRQAARERMAQLKAKAEAKAATTTKS
jgi:tetratricopeptide (TPR) repeat protein